mgnify:CR=1 FL=1
MPGVLKNATDWLSRGGSPFRWKRVGIVGAGGIGLPLAASVDTLAWPQVTVIFAAILITVFFAEWLSHQVRKRLI